MRPFRIFVCFATEDLRGAQDQIVADAKRLGFFDQIEVWDEQRLAAYPEYQNLPSSLKAGRGHGFFWWKPFIIRKALEESGQGALVFYSDCGRYRGGFRLGKGSIYLIHKYAETGFAGVEVPQFGPAVRWTRAECFSAVGCEPTKEGELPQIQATFCLWRNDLRSLKIIKEWESLCRIPNVVADPVGEENKKQPSEFVAHRHDQSVLTLLVRKYNVTYIDLSGPFSKRILPYVSRAEVVNVKMKQTEFVARTLKVDGSLLFRLFIDYGASKLIE